MIDVIGRIVTLLNRLGIPAGASVSADILTKPTLAEIEASAVLAKDATVAKEATSALIKTQTDKIAGNMLFSLDFWSLTDDEVQVTNVPGNKGLPGVIVADIPATATIVRANVLFKFRMVENINANPNALNGDQEIQVNDSGGTGWQDAVNFVDDQFTLAGATREGGDVCIGWGDVSNRVDGNDVYSIQWTAAVADVDGLHFNDVQVGIRVWYSI